MAQSPTFPKTPNCSGTIISTGTGTNIVSLYTGGANGSKVIAILATQNSTASIDVRINFQTAGSTYTLGTTTVPSNSGFVSGTPATALLNSVSSPGLPIDADGNPFIPLASSADSISCMPIAAVPTTGASIMISAIAGDF